VAGKYLEGAVKFMRSYVGIIIGTTWTTYMIAVSISVKK